MSRNSRTAAGTVARKDMERVPLPASIKPNVQHTATGACDRPNHMESVCCSKDKPRRLTPAAPSDNEGAIFDALCSIHNMENTHHRSAIPLGYQYDNLSYMWLRKRSTPQPFVNMTVKIMPDDYNAFRCRPVYHNNILLYFCHGRHRMPELPCQYEVHLGLRPSDLLLFNLQLHTATNGDIWILEVTLSACLEKTHRDESLKLGKWPTSQTVRTDSSSERKHVRIISPCKKQCDDCVLVAVYLHPLRSSFIPDCTAACWLVMFYRRSISCTTMFIIRSLSIWVKSAAIRWLPQWTQYRYVMKHIEDDTLVLIRQ